MRRNVIIVGMPRSGTSMAAHIFASRGYFAAQEPKKELRAGDEFNPAGYWEAQRLIDANVAVFNAVGYAQHNTWLFKPITEQKAASIAEIPKAPAHGKLVATYEANAPWLWKDPRLCYTLAYWWPLMNPRSTAVLLLTRHVEHIFRSFLRLGWRKSVDELDEVAQRVHAHRAAAERAIRQFSIPHIKIDYDDFANQPAETAQKISTMFGLEMREHDLGFDEVLNHSGARGRMQARVERLGLSLPASCRTILKKLTPRAYSTKSFRDDGNS